MTNLWACHDEELVREHLAATDHAGGTLFEQRHGSVAVVGLQGLLTKSGGFRATSTVDVAGRLDALAADADVDRVVLRIESGGGRVAGIAELGDTIARTNATKPVTAFIEDLGASAAFWAASQAGRVVANRMARVGSIGTYAVLYDASKLAADAGVKIHIVRAGEFKGAGTFGTEITEEQLGAMQRDIDAVNEHFIEAVAEGRRLPAARVRELADGRVHIAAEAQRLRLIDAVASFDDTLAAEVSAAGSTPQRRTKTMAATYGEILAGCAGCDPKNNDGDRLFVVDQQERGASVEAAQSAWMETLHARGEMRQQERTQGTTGVDPIEERFGGGNGDGDARSEWNEKVAAKVAKGMPRMTAVSRVNRENPGLREAMLVEVNGR